MSGGSIPRIDLHAVNWIIRRVNVGVGVVVATMIVAVIAIVAGLYAARHGSPLGGGLIWVKK